ncbi:hypothetical protein PACTADRAFT_24438, partial [Pachysolen tannophilus NRRL Y-2460]
KAEFFRIKGNEALKSKENGKAVALYTEGLLKCPNSYQLLCNRAAAYTLLNSIDHSIEDLTKAVELNPAFIAGWTRLGFSHLYQGNAVES